MGIRQAIIVTRQRRLFHFAARKENVMDAIVDMTPVGIARSDASTDVKPKFFIMIPLKVTKPVSRSC